MDSVIKIISKEEYLKNNKEQDQKEVWDNISDAWKKYRQAVIPAVIEFLKGKKGKVIDIGCGSGKGENSSINLAIESMEQIVIDDDFAIKVINSLNLKYIRTTTILLISLKRGLISKNECKELIQKLVSAGYYISPAVYSKLLEIIDKN